VQRVDQGSYAKETISAKHRGHRGHEECLPTYRPVQIEQAVLEMVLELHPQHLTADELVLRLAGDRDPTEPDSIRNAIRDLKCCGLLCYIDQVVAPTQSAVHAGELLR